MAPRSTAAVGRRRAAAEDAKMLPVIVEDSPLDGKPATRAAASVIEIELAAGRIRLKGAVDVEALRAVIDVLLCR